MFAPQPFLSACKWPSSIDDARVGEDAFHHVEVELERNGFCHMLEMRLLRQTRKSLLANDQGRLPQEHLDKVRSTVAF